MNMNLFAQLRGYQFNSGKHISNQQIKLNLMLPGIEIEQRIYKNMSLTLGGQYKLFTRFTNTDISDELFVHPNISLQYRFYYNYYARKELGKNTEKNSLNYIGFAPQVSYSKKYDYSRIISVHWGMQRSYGQWLFKTELGVNWHGLNTYDREGNTSIYSRFSFGYLIFNNK